MVCIALSCTFHCITLEDIFVVPVGKLLLVNLTQQLYPSDFAMTQYCCASAFVSHFAGLDISCGCFLKSSEVLVTFHIFSRCFLHCSSHFRRPLTCLLVLLLLVVARERFVFLQFWHCLVCFHEIALKCLDRNAPVSACPITLVMECVSSLQTPKKSAKDHR